MVKNCEVEKASQFLHKIKISVNRIIFGFFLAYQG